MICESCNTAVCTGGCRHATELFEVEPKFWDKDDVGSRGENMSKEIARELIEEWNSFGRKDREGCLGILEKKEI